MRARDALSTKPAGASEHGVLSGLRQGSARVGVRVRLLGEVGRGTYLPRRSCFT
ncbi:hypothetical protein L2K70_12650 [Nocardioides KLBMP 9356]|uniref:Uncharacterized protein n=1 Tax=Nocardioides potassii TaxID=2911371 RepID=A0ABS9HEB1_9ACTN|nr:hypothetical protein [Nocardioides potassii]MCF6378453.1 hypothetical protein [Nocardioides potassii]